MAGDLDVLFLPDLAGVVVLLGEREVLDLGEARLGGVRLLGWRLGGERWSSGLGAPVMKRDSLFALASGADGVADRSRLGGGGFSTGLITSFLPDTV